MSNLAVTRIPRPPKEMRDQARRDEIVAAARTCVVRRGFHAASMAEIASEAGMSVGQIYRYYPSKEAIVHAIVERIVETRLKWIVSSIEIGDLPTMLAKRFVSALEDTDDRDDRVLMLEVCAEATRSEAVAQIVRDADRRLRAKAVSTLRGDYKHVSEKDAAAIVEFFAALSEGTTLRRLTGMRTEERPLIDVYREGIRGVLGELKK